IEKMSKSRRNTIDPTDIMDVYGADTARWFMLSDSPPERDVIWTEEGIAGAHRFVQRIWRIVTQIAEAPQQESHAGNEDEILALRKQAHRSLKAIEESIEALRFNVAVAKIYELVNAVATATAHIGSHPAVRECLEILIHAM